MILSHGYGILSLDFSIHFSLIPRLAIFSFKVCIPLVVPELYPSFPTEPKVLYTLESKVEMVSLFKRVSTFQQEQQKNLYRVLQNLSKIITCFS